MSKGRFTLGAAKSAVSRSEAKQRRREDHGEELQPTSSQEHLGLRSFRQSHVCDSACDPCPYTRDAVE